MPERKLGFFVQIKKDDPALAGLTTGIKHRSEIFFFPQCPGPWHGATRRGHLNRLILAYFLTLIFNIQHPARSA
jgi:hypothetical protein